MSNAYPNVIHSRLTRHQLSNVLRCAERAKQTPSTFVRGLISKLGNALTGPADPQKAVEAIAEALGLPPDSDPDVLSAAFTALLTEINSDPSADAGASAEVPDPVPPKLGAAAPAAPPKKNPTPPAAQLSRETLNAIKAKGMTVAEFLERRDQLAVKRI